MAISGTHSSFGGGGRDSSKDGGLGGGWFSDGFNSVGGTLSGRDREIAEAKARGEKLGDKTAREKAADAFRASIMGLGASERDIMGRYGTPAQRAQIAYENYRRGIGVGQYERQRQLAANAAALQSSRDIDVANLASGDTARAIASQMGVDINNPDAVLAAAAKAPTPKESAALLGYAANTGASVSAAQAFNEQFGTNLAPTDMKALAQQGVDLSALGPALNEGLVDIDKGKVKENTFGTLAAGFAPLAMPAATMLAGPVLGATLPGIYGMFAEKALPSMGLQQMLGAFGNPMSAVTQAGYGYLQGQDFTTNALGPLAGFYTGAQNIAGLQQRLGLRDYYQPETRITGPRESRDSIYMKYYNTFRS